MIQDCWTAVAYAPFPAFLAQNRSGDDMRRFLVLLGFAAMVSMAPASVRAQEYVLTIKDHKFTPEELKVPANQRVIITVINNDATAEEFESNVLKVEKVIAGNSKATVRIGPLAPGRYPFIGEFHEATAKGVVVAE
jgi:plastocyanin